MKYSLIAFLAVFSTSAFAHPGHTEQVAGHTHTLVELALYSAFPVVGLALLGAYFLSRRKKS
jgi:hypothetical protein